MDNKDSALDKEAIILDPEVEESDDDLISDEGEESDDKELFIDSIYTSRSGVKWTELPTKLLQKRKAQNLLKHKAGPTVSVKTEVRQFLLLQLNMN